MLRSIGPRRVISLVAGAALLAGCTTVGPNFTAPAAPGVAGYTREALPSGTASAPGALGAAQRFVPEASTHAEWWREFGSKRLDDLVGQALEHSPTLAAAEATLRQAQQTYAAQAGSTLYPTLGAKLSASRNEADSSSTGQRTAT
ncbi:MAG TPA: TolC family protein, partial [Casimicrobiaceae bacterium]|nr:TolC family protein [Casimicrobiaceae bacterium]